MGTPKALLTDASGTPRTLLAARALLAAGCEETLVVLGAAATEAGRLLTAAATPDDAVATLVAEAWEEGMGLSLRVGLEELARSRQPRSGVLVTLVDLPDVGAPVHRRVADAWRSAGARPEALLRATYAGEPGHPVLLGRDHWEPLAAELTGDIGAQRYLARHTVREVSCDDLATGRDTDRPEDLGAIRVGEEGPR
jgi:CTP:molybdopterin cytidylyltransferase MocA